MQSSKQKAQCAYAKVCKSKQKSHLAKKDVNPSPRNKRSENIYEELMNELDLEESEYIQRLCKKNEEKMRRNEEASHEANKNEHFQEISNLLSDASQKSIRNLKKQCSSPKPNVSSTSSRRSSKRDKKENVKVKAQLFQNPRSDSHSHSQSSHSEQPFNRYFLNNLDHYIASLNESEEKSPEKHGEKTVLNKYQSQNERDFRRTVEFPTSKAKKSSENTVSHAKYSKLLDKLHEQLVEKQALEYKLECKDLKMSHMKKMIQSMHDEIIMLQRDLKLERQQKDKYSSMADEFVSKVHHVRTSSREKHYIPHHQKRNSHIPSSSSSYANDFNDYFNRTGWQEGKSNNLIRSQFQKVRERDEVNTLKKKGMHKFKVSELYNDGNESIQDRASIYRDSYL